MSWTTPKTWTTGEIPTAANFNAQIRDNLAFVFPGPSKAVYPHFMGRNRKGTMIFLNDVEFNVPLDTIIEDNVNGWDDDEDEYTCPYTGMYAVGAAWNRDSAVTAVQRAVVGYGVTAATTTIRFATFQPGQIGSAESAGCGGFLLLRCTAGWKIALRISTSTWGSYAYTASLSIAYLHP